MQLVRLVLGVAFASPSLRPALVQQLRRLEMLALLEEIDELKPPTPPGEVSDYSREDDEPPGCWRPYPLGCSSGLSRAYEDSEDDEDSRAMGAIQHPRWPGLEMLMTLAGVQVEIHGLVTPLGRQLNGCLGTIVRVDTAAKRYVVKVDNFGLKSIKPEDLELIIEPLNRANSRG